MLILQNISFAHPGKSFLFDGINLTVNHHDKIALTGNNGSGKSTLLKIIAKEFLSTEGQVRVLAQPYVVPQIYGQYNHLTIGQALKVAGKINALHAIMQGNASKENYTSLDDDWNIEERCRDALRYWQLTHVDLQQKMETLSGGQKTKVFLAGISIHEPAFVLLDEPGNHLDLAGKQLLYKFIQHTQATLILVSHDRKLLNLAGKVAALTRHGIKMYGGNYDFYKEQKQIEHNALQQDLLGRQKALRKARNKERETLERQQRSDSRGKGKQEKAGVARIMMNTLRNHAENSTAKMKAVHAEKIDDIKEELQELRSVLPAIDEMKFGFDDSSLHKGKILLTATAVNHIYNNQLLWKNPVSFHITSGERIALKGLNGSGKTTLIKMVLGIIIPQEGTIEKARHTSVYIDQEYSLIDNQLHVYEQALQFNVSGLQEHEIKTRLNRFLFTKDDWDKPCHALSGGEKMRLVLCCLTILHQAPDIIILDEPTNNLDIQNIDILTAAIVEYHGTLIVVSHDETFLEQVNIERSIEL